MVKKVLTAPLTAYTVSSSIKEIVMDITGLDKAKILAALYNGSKQQGLGFMCPEGRESISEDQARELLKDRNYFHYLNGRVMKIDLSKDELFTGLYNRDNGHGAAERIIEELRK